MGHGGKNNKCKQCGSVIRDFSSGFCPECGATVLSKKSKKTVICHAIRGAAMVRYFFVVILLIAACFYSVWNIKHVIEFKETLQPDYLAAEQMLQTDGAIEPVLQKAHSDYELADIYYTYGMPVIVGVNAVTALFALLGLIRLRFAYVWTSAFNIIGLVLLCADTLCLFLYSVPMNYIYAATAFVVRFLLIFVLAGYIKKARSETTRRRRRKKGEIDTSGTVDMYDTSMFTSDMKTLKRKIEREGQSDFEIKNSADAMGEVTLISKGTPMPKATETKEAPAVPVAVATPKKTNDQFGDDRHLDAVAQLAAAVSELTGEEMPAPAPTPVAKAEPAPAPTPVAKAEPAPAPTPVAKAEPAPAPKPVAKAEPAPTPTPVAKAEPAPAPTPVAKAEPAPAPTPVAKAEPAPAPKPVAKAEPAPAPTPVAKAESAPAPKPVEKAEPTPPAIVKPVPQPTPMPAPKKEHPEFKADSYYSPMDELAATIAALDIGAAEIVNEEEPAPTPVAKSEPAPAPTPVAKAEPAPAPTPDTKAEKRSLFKKLSFGKKNEEEAFPEDEFGITDQEPIPLSSFASPAVKEEAEEDSEKTSEINRTSGPWQCPHCGQMNYASSTSCMNCGVDK